MLSRLKEVSVEKNGKILVGNVRRFVLKLAGVGVGVWVGLILADVIAFYYTYSRSYNTLEQHGLSEYGAKIVGLIFASIFMLTVHGALWSIIKRDFHRWVPMVAGGLLVWFAIMFFVSLPYSNNIFNPLSGEVQFKYYRDNDDRIVRMPKTAKTGPEGQTLHLFDQQAAEEYRNQETEEKKVTQRKKEEPSSISLTTPTPLCPPTIVVTREWSEWVRVPLGYRIQAQRQADVAYEMQTERQEEEPYFLPRGKLTYLHLPRLKAMRFRVAVEEVVDSVNFQITCRPIPVS